MWVARDKSGVLHLFSEKPERHSSYQLEYWKVDVPYSTIALDDKLYPKLTWEDEPVEFLLVTKDANETESHSGWEEYLGTLDFQGVDITFEDLMLAYEAGYRKAKEE